MRVDQMDFVSNDPRSVKAWLAGKGDRRDQLWNAFHRYALRRNPKLSEDQIARLYPAALQAGWEWRYPLRVVNLIAIPVLLYGLGVLAVSLHWI